MLDCKRGRHARWIEVRGGSLFVVRAGIWTGRLQLTRAGFGLGEKDSPENPDQRRRFLVRHMTREVIKNAPELGRRELIENLATMACQNGENASTIDRTFLSANQARGFHPVNATGKSALAQEDGLTEILESKALVRRLSDLK